MGNHKLRKQLGKLLKENGMGKLYTCNKRHAYKYLNNGRMKIMIKIFSLKPGMAVHDYGVNQVIKKALNFRRFDNKYGLIKSGYVWGDPDQVEYESGYLSCGCGVCEAYLVEDGPLKTKEEIIANLKLGFENKNWGPSYLAIEYFELLKQGIDIITEDGFLVSNWRDLCNTIDSHKLMEEWREKMKDQVSAKL